MAAVRLLILAIAVSWLSVSHAKPVNTHALVIATCPTWKEGGDAETTRAMAESCAKTVQLVQDSFVHHLRIPKENHVVLLNKDSTYARVEESIFAIKSKLKPKDRLLVYILVHGGIIQGRYAGNLVSDQAMALWTDEEPNLASAVDEKKFMLVKTFRDLLLEGLTSQDVIVVFDSCHSGAGYSDFRYNPYASDDLRVAAIFSSQADESANFTYDLQYPLFTRKLTHAFELSAYRDMGFAVELAASATHRTQRARCASPTMRQVIEKAGVPLQEVCLQMPYVYDPEALLQDWLIIPNEE